MIVLVNKDYYKIYEQFGNPEERMIDALTAIRDGILSIPDRSELMSMPTTDCKRIELNCDEIIDGFPNRMVRGLIHWFIDIEGYAELNWRQADTEIDYKSCINKLEKANKLLIKVPQTKIIVNLIEELKNEYREKLTDSNNYSDSSNNRS